MRADDPGPASGRSPDVRRRAAGRIALASALAAGAIGVVATSGGPTIPRSDPATIEAALFRPASERSSSALPTSSASSDGSSGLAFVTPSIPTPSTTTVTRTVTQTVTAPPVTVTAPARAQATDSSTGTDSSAGDSSAGTGSSTGTGTSSGLLPTGGGVAGVTGGASSVVGALFDSAAGDFASHFDNSGNSGLVEDGPRPTVITNPIGPSPQAFGFTLGPGGKRSEVLPIGAGTKPVEGEQQYVRYSFVLGTDFPTTTDQWQILLQWHHTSANGSPPLSLEISRGQLMMVSGGNDEKIIGAVSPGQRINLTMAVRFSQNPSLASVTVLRDGQTTGVADWHPVRGTMSTPTAYLKMGYYRSQRIAQQGTFAATDLKIASTPSGIGGLGVLGTG